MAKSGNSLWKAWQKTAARFAARNAVIQAETGQAFSFASLNEQVEKFAWEHLSSASRSIVAFSLRNNIQWLTVFLACQAVGAAALPLDPDLPGEAHETAACALGAQFLWKQEALQRLGKRHNPQGAQPWACIKISSGTSGKPTPVFCKPAHLLADGANIIATMKIRPSDRNLGLIPLGHSYGLGNLVMPLILQGTAVVCAESFLPRQIPHWVEKHSATVFPTVPSVLRVLAQLPVETSARPLRLVISAGSVLPPEVAQAFYQRFGLKPHNLYGASETGSIAYDRTGAATLSGRSIGKPLENVAVAIARSGRVSVRSRAVAKPGARLVLQDFGKFNRLGELCLLGRAGVVANIGGRKVHPSEVEAILRRAPNVTDVWVGVFQERDREYLGAVVESANGLCQVQHLLTRALPSWKLPRILKTMPSLPRTSRGKVDVEKVRTLITLA